MERGGLGGFAEKPKHRSAFPPHLPTPQGQNILRPRLTIPSNDNLSV